MKADCGHDCRIQGKRTQKHRAPYGLATLLHRYWIVGLALLLVIWLLPSIFQINEEWQPKINTLVIFVGISILLGIWWDHKNYRWIRNTKIDEMPVAIVSKRMASFRRWTRYEIIAISVWVIVFNVLNYWVMGYYKASFGVQATLIAFFVLCDIAIIYLLYKKVDLQIP